MKFLEYLFFFFFASLISYSVHAQSAKATAAVGKINILDSADMGWSTIMSKQIRTANKKDLFMDVSLECGLYTKTQVKGKKGSSDSSSANAAVMLRVLVDGKEAKPGLVTFCSREQELSAVLGGVLESCSDSNGDGTIVSDECEFSDEEITLMLKTMNANSFNFILDNLSSGSHSIEVQAQIQSTTEAGQGSASAMASIGKGSVVVEEVRMINDEMIDF